MDTVKFEHIL